MLPFQNTVSGYPAMAMSQNLIKCVITKAKPHVPGNQERDEGESAPGPAWYETRSGPVLWPIPDLKHYLAKPDQIEDCSLTSWIRKNYPALAGFNHYLAWRGPALCGIYIAYSVHSVYAADIADCCPVCITYTIYTVYDTLYILSWL